MKGIFAKILKYAVTLFVVTVVASGSLAYTYSVTADRIEKMRLREQLNAVKDVCPEAEAAEVTKDDGLAEKAAKKVEILKAVFKVEKDGKIVAYAMLTAPRGYGGPMSVMVGLTESGKVTGVKVLEHKETPGLGDKVVLGKDFLSQFSDKGPDDPVEVKEDIEAVSGATISSKGVTQGVRAALDAYSALKAGETE
jgi:electron transport complex protein RnfG